MTELAKSVAGGKAKVCHLELSTRAVAKVVRSVVIATGGISPPLSEGLAHVQSILAP